VSDGANELPPQAERRPKARRRVLFGGIVTYFDGQHHIACTIRNLTPDGARISVPIRQPIPSNVYLINLKDRVAYESTIVWNTGSEAGLAFSKILPLAEITDPALAYLKKLWHEAAMR
jgi:hypothetical protein